MSIIEKYVKIVNCLICISYQLVFRSHTLPSNKNLDQTPVDYPGGGGGDGNACNWLADYGEASLGFHNIFSLYVCVPNSNVLSMKT